MAAGLGFKDFVTGEVLTAADVDGYLMQGVWVFASAAARDAAVTSPQEGNFAYLKDTNVTTYYTGSAWANLDTTGMTNPMTTTGDTIYSSSGSTPARLGIGTTGQVLTVAGGVPSWATSAAGGMTLLDTVTLSGSSTTSNTFSSAYNQILVFVSGAYASAEGLIQMRINGDSGTNYSFVLVNAFSSVTFDYQVTGSVIWCGYIGTSSTNLQMLNGLITITNPSQTTEVFVNAQSLGRASSNPRWFVANGVYNNSAAVTQLTFLPTSGTFSAGTAYIYGVK
jgi:hypothetical protein